jgi:hypothetical protein
MSALLYSAIPFVLTHIIGDHFDFDAIRGAMRTVRKEGTTVKLAFCRFAWDMQIQTLNSVSQLLLVREVVDTPEFRQRLGNILSKRDKYIFTVAQVTQEGEDAVIYMTGTIPSDETPAVVRSACILRGNRSDELHYTNKRGTCMYCGSQQ